jgi:ornithine decarboxylase
MRFRKCLPDVIPYYAIKANPHPGVIKTFIKLGASFDVASAAEMKQVLALGASPSKIIFANTIKSNEDIITARRRRVRRMTFDNEPELYKLAKHYPRAHVLVRIKVENIGSMVELSLKFGADPEQAFFLLRKAKALGLVPVGVSFHVGSQSTNVENYIQALEIAAGIFKEAKQHGLPLRIMDIGGGFPIQHFDNEIGINFERMAAQIRQEMRRLFDRRVKFIAEPGRFFAGPAGVLVTQVIGRTFRNNKNYYYLNDGIYGDFSGMVFDHCKYEFKTLRRGQKFLSTLAGPTCDSFDTLSLNEEIPELYVGDVVYVKNIGAYSCASAVAGFNGFAPAKIVMV